MYRRGNFLSSRDLVTGFVRWKPPICQWFIDGVLRKSWAWETLGVQLAMPHCDECWAELSHNFFNLLFSCFVRSWLIVSDYSNGCKHHKNCLEARSLLRVCWGCNHHTSRLSVGGCNLQADHQRCPLFHWTQIKSFKHPPNFSNLDLLLKCLELSRKITTDASRVRCPYFYK